MKTIKIFSLVVSLSKSRQPEKMNLRQLIEIIEEKPFLNESSASLFVMIRRDSKSVNLKNIFQSLKTPKKSH